MDSGKARTIELVGSSDREFFLIHGYTGSPMDFNRLPHLLNKVFDAHVKVLLLKGHGTSVQDLDTVDYCDLLLQVEQELKADIAKGRKVILGGVSFGGLVAFTLASRYPVVGVFDVCSPYMLKFPFTIPFLRVLVGSKKYWKKAVTIDTFADHRKTYAYDYMHVRALEIVKQAQQDVKTSLHLVTCPVLSIHSCADPISKYASSKKIQRSIRSYTKKMVLINTKIHNMFFSSENPAIYKEIVHFIEKNNLFTQQSNEATVAAVVPAYDEAERIGGVLDVLTKTTVLDEIVVVDDGSHDNTEAVVAKYPTVRYLKNKTNIGKAGSMNRGVQATRADIIFFCDADLINLTSSIVETIIAPVKMGITTMSIGLRSNFMQKTVHLFAINSGERALRRVIWEQLPAIFKYKYRIEAGLNYFVGKYYGGFEYREFNYTQPTKERKYGAIRGTLLRWLMNFDVLYAYVIDIVGLNFDKQVTVEE